MIHSLQVTDGHMRKQTFVSSARMTVGPRTTTSGLNTTRITIQTLQRSIVAVSRAHAVAASAPQTGWRKFRHALCAPKIGTFRTLAAATVAWSINVDSSAQ